jgi:hypothetical protein
VTVSLIISGGQTGADRGGLLAAHDLGIPRGGMAPAGWRAEDGVIPEWFRTGMWQSGATGYRVRTRANVEASSGTLILCLGELPHDSGSMLTANLARRIGKPILVVNIWSGISDFAIGHVREWIGERAISTLNVAGPRESREPGIQEASRAALVAILGLPDDAGFGG